MPKRVHCVSTHVPDSFYVCFMYIYICYICVYSVIRSTKTDPGPEGGGGSVYIYLSSALVKCSSLETLKQDSYTIFTIIVLEK